LLQSILSNKNLQ